eukprot:361751-Chlamydomonas_euryale.AAC.4
MRPPRCQPASIHQAHAGAWVPGSSQPASTRQAHAAAQVPASCSGDVVSRVSFDVLVVAVGEQPATLGVPGVAEHCFFMKEISDTVKLRTKASRAGGRDGGGGGMEERGGGRLPACMGDQRPVYVAEGAIRWAPANT